MIHAAEKPGRDNISKTEINAGQYTEFLNAVAKSDPYGVYNPSMDSFSAGCQITRHGSSGSYTYNFSGGTVESPGSTTFDWADRPVNYVSWGDAARFCNWLHNGQPSGMLTGNPALDAKLTEDGSYYVNGGTSQDALMAVTRKPDQHGVMPDFGPFFYLVAFINGNSGRGRETAAASPTAVRRGWKRGKTRYIAPNPQHQEGRGRKIKKISVGEMPLARIAGKTNRRAGNGLFDSLPTYAISRGCAQRKQFIEF